MLCGSDALVRLYNCENDENWRGFIQKTADNNVPIGQLSPKDFKAMMEDASIWGDISENNSPWSPEALNLLYQYTGGNAICGKLFGNELLNKIMRGDFNRREKLYPSDITQVAYELLNSEVGLVRNLLVLHNTKNLEEEIPYLIFIAHELIHDRNKSDVSIRRIREFFAVKSPSAIESALKVLIARGILKVNEEKQRYGFSTMFYFDFFRSQATEVRLHEVSIQLQAERKQDNMASYDEGTGAYSFLIFAVITLLGTFFYWSLLKPAGNGSWFSILFDDEPEDYIEEMEIYTTYCHRCCSSD